MKLFFGILVIVLSTCPPSCCAQDVSEITHYFHQVRMGKQMAIPESIRTFEDSRPTVEAVLPYLTDSSNDVRSKACEIIFSVSIRAADRPFRSMAVEVLSRTCLDFETETTGYVLDLLTKFNSEDFTTAAKDNVRKMLSRKTVYLKELIKIAGFLELKDQIPFIREFAQPGNRSAVRWTALVSLARMSDKDALAEVMSRVKKLAINDDLIYDVFPDLIYTRQAVAINYVVELLYSDMPNCLSADAEREVAIPCAYRLIEMLATVIDGYPLPLERSGDLRTDDYPAALAIVREWFESHKEYGIRTNEF